MATDNDIRSNQEIIDQYQIQIQKLKEGLPTEYEAMQLPDEFLLRCLFSRNMDIEAAVKLMNNAVRLHKDYNVILDTKGMNMNILGVSMSYVSGVRTIEGHRVIFHDISKWNTSKGNYYDTNYCLTLLQGGIGWNDLSASMDGVVVVTDATVVNLYHIKEVTFNMKSSGISADALTNYLPYCNRYNVVINASYGADLLWKGASLIMPKQMVETMHFVRRGDNKTLSKFFSPEVIEKELYRPTQADLDWTREVIPQYAKYRNSLYSNISAAGNQVD